MDFCWLLLPVSFVGIFFHFFAIRLLKMEDVEESIPLTLIALLAAILLGLPGIILFVMEFFGWFSGSEFYHEFRSLPYIDLAYSLTGFATGGISGAVKRYVWRVNTVAPILLLFVLIYPFMWSYETMLPVGKMNFSWKNDVCVTDDERLATIASAATILKHFDVNFSETQLAKECYAYEGGAHIWYVARAFGARDFEFDFNAGVKDLTEIKYPCLLRVKSITSEYFISVIAIRGNTLNIADPLKGRRYLSIDEFVKEYFFTGMTMSLSSKR